MISETHLEMKKRQQEIVSGLNINTTSDGLGTIFVEMSIITIFGLKQTPAFDADIY